MATLCRYQCHEVDGGVSPSTVASAKCVVSPAVRPAIKCSGQLGASKYNPARRHAEPSARSSWPLIRSCLAAFRTSPLFSGGYLMRWSRRSLEVLTVVLGCLTSADALAEETASEAQTFGTAIPWTKDVDGAFQAAASQSKPVMLLNLSGNFAKNTFT